MRYVLLMLIVCLTLPGCRGSENAKGTTCESNLKMIGLAFAQYQQDFGERLPPSWVNVAQAGYGQAPSYTWRKAIFPYTYSERVFQCPQHSQSNLWNATNNEWGNSGYGLNLVHADRGAPTPPAGVSYSQVQDWSVTILLTDFDGGTNPIGISYASNKHDFRRNDPGATRHKGGAVYLFFDGHVRFLTPEQVNCGAGTIVNKPNYVFSLADYGCPWSIE